MINVIWKSYAPYYGNIRHSQVFKYWTIIKHLFLKSKVTANTSHWLFSKLAIVAMMNEDLISYLQISQPIFVQIQLINVAILKHYFSGTIETNTNLGIGLEKCLAQVKQSIMKQTSIKHPDNKLKRKQKVIVKTRYLNGDI